MKIFQLQLLTFVIAAMLMIVGGCSTAPATSPGKAALESQAEATLMLAKGNDATFQGLLDKSMGYAVFPDVGKGAVGLGGAYGKGVLYEKGKVVGYTDLTQATLGVQLGGQSYAEILVFNTHDALTMFKARDITFDAQASAVAIESGSSANAKFRNGIAVFTMGESGLMYEASVGGQRFDYLPKE